jgi:hypothetical protein
MLDGVFNGLLYVIRFNPYLDTIELNNCIGFDYADDLTINRRIKKRKIALAI